MAETESVGEVLAWLEDQRRRSTMRVERIPLREAEHWSEQPSGSIAHDSGEFFEVIGIRVTQGEDREQTQWCQPIIYQKEMGILGIARKRGADGEWRYLLQAKAEPGNLHGVLLSPTLQATFSNLRQAHKGKKPLFAEHFEQPRSERVVFALWQAEDGGRLHRKSNLNMLIDVDEDDFAQLPDRFRWFTMAEIKQLILHENVVSIHVRSIISAL